MPLDLIGLNEIGRLAGVTRQRAFILVNKFDFPAPVADPPTGRLWYRAEVKAWLATWPRQPGRPSGT